MCIVGHTRWLFLLSCTKEQIAKELKKNIFLPVIMKNKTDFQTGLEIILNNKETSFLRSPAVFSEIQKQSGMTHSSMIKHIARTSKKVKELTDDERVKQRLQDMEKKSDK